MIDKIMKQKELLDKPPILIDIGASGEIHQSWKEIAPYSICIGFDADDRETDFYESEIKGYKKLYIFNSIVSESSKNTDFYLTKSPYCSSRLEPNYKELKNWAFGDIFEVVKKINMKSITINEILNRLNLDYIDWYKTDSQGTDVRIFDSIEQDIVDKIGIAEFEPGIMNAYKKEDSLSELMIYMRNKNFWVSDIIIKGSQRISQKNFKKYFSYYIDRLYDFPNLLKNSACWAEISYINTYEKDIFDKRDYLLGCAISILNKQYGFAIDIASKAKEKYQDIIFDEIIEYCIKEVKSNEFKLFFTRVIRKIKYLLGMKKY